MKRDREAMSRALRGDPRCRVCLLTEGLQVHHIVPRSRTQQGAEDDANLVVLCHEHHRKVHDRTLDLGSYLSKAEQAKAVLLTGSIGQAYRLLYPSEHSSKVAA